MADENKLKDENLEKVTGGVPPMMCQSNISNPDKMLGDNAIYGAGAGDGIHFVSAGQGTESQTDNLWPFKATVQNVPVSNLDGGEGRHPRK